MKRVVSIVLLLILVVVAGKLFSENVVPVKVESKPAISKSSFIETFGTSTIPVEAIVVIKKQPIHKGNNATIVGESNIVVLKNCTVSSDGLIFKIESLADIVVQIGVKAGTTFYANAVVHGDIVGN